MEVGDGRAVDAVASSVACHGAYGGAGGPRPGGAAAADRRDGGHRVGAVGGGCAGCGGGGDPGAGAAAGGCVAAAVAAVAGDLTGGAARRVDWCVREWVMGWREGPRGEQRSPGGLSHDLLSLFTGVWLVSASGPALSPADTGRALRCATCPARRPAASTTAPARRAAPPPDRR